MSGFFFCGITLDGDVKLSDSSMNENSDDDQMIKSSANLLRFVIIIAEFATYSATKSRVLVASIEFSTSEEKPSIFAVLSLSIGRLVPPTGPAPSGLWFTRVYRDMNLSKSRSKESVYDKR